MAITDIVVPCWPLPFWPVEVEVTVEGRSAWSLSRFCELIIVESKKSPFIIFDEAETLSS